MKSIIRIVFGLFILVSCNQTEENENPSSNNSTQQEQLNGLYKITSEKKNADTGKSNIEIELKEKVSEETLISIAKEVRNTRTEFDKLWIFYYLPGMKVGAGAWATSHFTPDLQVEILGTTAEEEAKLKTDANKVDGKIIGEFFEQQYTSASYTYYEKNGKPFIKMTFKDGSSSEDEMKTRKVNNGIRLDYKVTGTSNGEYYILTNSNVLQFYNAENKMFTTADKIK